MSIKMHHLLKIVNKKSLLRTLTTLHNHGTKKSLNEGARLENQESGVLHKPVMASEVVELLNIEKSQNILDMTFGSGGHSKEILKKYPDINLYCLDRDPLAIQIANDLAQQNPQVKPMLGCFSEVHTLLEKHYGVHSVHGVILDAGVSSMQFDNNVRGFSISRDGPLDMRMDQDRTKDQMSAYDVVNHMSEANLYHIIKQYGEEKNAKLIARAIVDHRYSIGAIKTTFQLAAIVSSAFPPLVDRRDKCDRPAHPATKTFQAIRIFVNDELNELKNAMDIVHQLLVPGGVFIAISFHSLEDRVIKRHFHGIAMDLGKNVRSSSESKLHILDRDELDVAAEKKWNVIKKRVTLPSEIEIESNPRSRSAKLRFAYKNK